MRRNMKVQLVILAAFTVYGFTKEKEYLSSIYGMQGLRIFCDTDSKLKYVHDYEGLPGFDFLKITRVIHIPIEVLVTAEKLQPFKNSLEVNDINYEIFMEDVGIVIEEQFALQMRARLENHEDDVPLKAFPRYDEITSYLENLGKIRNDIVEIFSIGKSFENRDIVGVKISTGGKGKPALFIDAGIHAREWIAPTTALYIINQLAENSSNTYIFENIDIYVIPCLNPDGYEYTHMSPSTRMWRKTRSTLPDSNCIGTDANRNFEFKWMTVGASNNPCSEIYAGFEPFSEPETISLRNFILTKENIKVYLTLHSYGNFLLYPWGYTDELPVNEPVLKCVAQKANDNLSKIRGTQYEIGTSTNVLYPAAGGSDDWAMGIAGIELAYTIELPSKKFGFNPPISEILPVGIETFEAIRVFAKYVESNNCEDF